MSWALKNLHHQESRTPYLDTPTAPQFQLNDEQLPRPLQDEYPVWYFLTGQLSRANKLMKLLKLDRQPDMRVASIKGLEKIHKRQFSVVVPPTLQQTWWSEDCCVGWAYRVKNQKEERRLRYFKTNYFSVVRCKITLSAKGTFGHPTEVDGLTFVYSIGETISRYMNSLHVASIPGSISYGRRPKLFQCFEATAIALKAPPTTAITGLVALAAPATTMPAMLATTPAIPHARWWELKDLPESQAAQDRQTAIMGWEDRRMGATRTHSIPKRRARRNSIAIVLSLAKATAGAKEGSWWEKLFGAVMEKLARAVEMPGESESVGHIENIAPAVANLNVDSKIKVSNNGAAARMQSMTTGGPALTDVSTQGTSEQVQGAV